MVTPRKQVLVGLAALAGLSALVLVLNWGGRAPDTPASPRAADTPSARAT